MKPVGNSNSDSALKKRRDFCDLTALIQSIQKMEGKKACFRKQALRLACTHMECEWRPHCKADNHIP